MPSDVFVSPEVLDFGEVYLGTSATRALQVTNAGRGSQALLLVSPPPFLGPAELALPGGASAELPLDFLPTAPGPIAGSLVVGGKTVALRGTGLEVPECSEPASACSSARFEPAEGRCVETPLAEGTACASRCVSRGTCSQGVCAGEFASCEDGDACTDDACSEQQGCTHAPRQCPASPDNPCRVGACDPLQGCLFIDAADGVLCGPKSCRTNTVPVCIAAQCVDRPLPTPECLNQFAWLKASNAEAGDSFGNRLALSADGATLAVGASQANAVYVFHRVGITWAQEAALSASNAAAGDAFGYAVAISADGSTLVVGAHLEDGLDDALPESGAVYVFARRGGTWTEEASLKASNAGPADTFGASVAVSADGARLAVGAAGEDSSGPPGDDSAGEAGAVYLFKRSGAGWSQDAYLKPSNVEAGDLFGFSVALAADGSTLAVGALGEDSSATGVNGSQADGAAPQSGAVYLFRVAEGATTQAAFVKASNTGAADVFGISVALSADGAVLAVGAYGEDSGDVGVDGNQASNAASQSGAVYVFRRQGGSWAQEAYVKASNTWSGDDFGYSLALAGDGRALAVGAWSEDSASTGIDGHQFDDGATDSGAVYLFRQVDGVWAPDAYLKASNTDPWDFFGHSVALSGDATTLVSAAPGEDSNARGINGNQLDNSAQDSGAVYVFSLQ